MRKARMSPFYTEEEAQRAKQNGISRKLLKYRLKQGWDKERAISTPSNSSNKKKAGAWDDVIYTAYKGDEILGTGNVYELSKILGISLQACKRCTTNSWKEKDKGNATVFEEVGTYSEENFLERWKSLDDEC